MEENPHYSKEPCHAKIHELILLDYVDSICTLFFRCHYRLVLFGGEMMEVYERNDESKF